LTSATSSWQFKFVLEKKRVPKDVEEEDIEKGKRKLNALM